MHTLCTTEFYFLRRTETDPGATKSIASSEWQIKEKIIENESTRKIWLPMQTLFITLLWQGGWIYSGEKKDLNKSSNIWIYEILTTIVVDIKSSPWILDFLFIFSEIKNRTIFKFEPIVLLVLLKALTFIRKNVIKPWLCLFKWYYSFISIVYVSRLNSIPKY